MTRQSEDYFRQIFGSSPKFEEGMMWVIRKEEMNQMAQTISPDKNSYFLDFMNLHVPYGGLTELNNEYHEALTKLGKADPREHPRTPLHWNLKLLE